MDRIVIDVFKCLNDIKDEKVCKCYQGIRVSEQIAASFHACIQNCLSFLVSTECHLTLSTYDYDNGKSYHEFYTVDSKGTRLKKHQVEFHLYDVKDDTSLDRLSSSHLQVGDNLFHNPYDCLMFLQNLRKSLIESDSNETICTK